MIINYLKKCPVHQDGYHYLSYNSHLNEIMAIGSPCCKEIKPHKPTDAEEKMFKHIRKGVEYMIEKRLDNHIEPSKKEGYDFLTPRGKAEMVIVVLEDTLFQFFKIRDIKKDLPLDILKKWIDNSIADLYLFVALDRRTNKSLTLF